ncbi:hypothetical protein [Kordia jejudonensis]|uniref:hypothetical protein n=1 Tax=Kordia jejudonensis TaxID=1348245 RepID=UPI000629D0A0|nr:hypothetical protein [Kordia jejudonensis]
MSQDVYILREHIDSGEMHLFLASKTKEDECYAKQKSICGKMDADDASKTIFSCQPENSARKQCAKVGKQVCSKCISYLYDNGIDLK